jgi:hypothetical protein
VTSKVRVEIVYSDRRTQELVIPEMEIATFLNDKNVVSISYLEDDNFKILHGKFKDLDAYEDIDGYHIKLKSSDKKLALEEANKKSQKHS